MFKIMSKLYNYIIVLNFFLVWIGFYLPEQIKTSIGLLGILSIGLIHGSNDIFIENLSGFVVNESIYLFNILVSLILTSISFILCAKKIKSKASTIVLNIFYLLLFTATFYVSGLIWSFALYFVLWHSLPSLKDQIDFSFGSFNFQNLLMYLKQSFVYWLISIIGLIVFYFLLKDTKYILSILFAFIASVTIPHVFVVKKMFEKKAST